VLAPIQYFSAPDSILNIYSNQSDMGVPVIALAGDHARVTGTFSYLTGFTLLLSLVSLGTAAHLAIAGRARTRLLLCGALAVLITEILMTGSRAPVLILAAGFPAGFVLARYTRFPRHATHPILFLGLIVAAAVLATSAFPEVLQSFTQRATSSDDVWQRIFMPFVAGLNELAAPGPFGYGPGTTYQGAAILIPNGFVGPLPARAEAEWQRIVLELGPLGLIAVVLVRLSISYELWTALRQCEDLRLQPFLIAALLFTVIVVPGNLVFDHTASIYYWFIAGLALIRPAPL